jgi:hypothetical protein
MHVPVPPHLCCCHACMANAAPFHAQSEAHDRPYYFNRVTRESSWERPADSNVAWVRFHEEL